MNSSGDNLRAIVVLLWFVVQMHYLTSVAIPRSLFLVNKNYLYTVRLDTTEVMLCDVDVRDDDDGGDDLSSYC